MKCRVFNLRLQKEHTASDEVALDEFLSTVTPKRIFASVAGDHNDCWSVLIFYEDEPSDSSEERDLEEDIVLTPYEQMDYEDLRRWRSERANQDGLAPYMIAHNDCLKQMVKLPVRTREDLLRIKGFGQKRTDKYGDDILKVLTGPREARRIAEP